MQKKRLDWNQIKDGVMDRALRAKFTQSRKLRDLLKSTGNRELIENSPHDAYWGVGPQGNGENKLGKALMRLRGSL